MELTKENIFKYLDTHGYTEASVDNYDKFPRGIVLEHLEQSDKKENFKEYFRKYITEFFIK